MIYGIEKRYAKKLIGVPCRIQTGLFMEPTLWLGETGYYLQADRDGTFTLFDPDEKELAEGDFFVVCREAKKLLKERGLL